MTLRYNPQNNAVTTQAVSSSISAPSVLTESRPSTLRFTHEDWKRKVLRDMSTLDQNPDEASALSKRGF